MIDLQFTTGSNLGSGNIPAVNQMLRFMKAILPGIAATAVKPTKKAHRAQLEP